MHAMLEGYADHDLFTQAVQRHIDKAAAQTQPLQEQLHAQRSLITARQRVLDRYQRDYEAGTLAAERYESRAAALQDELKALQAHAADLELQLDAGPPRVPDAEELNELRERLTTRLRTGSIPVRKSLCNNLIESLVVNARDDIVPTFRLLTPATDEAVGAATATVEALTSDGAAPDGSWHDKGPVFAHRAPLWR